MGYGRATDLGLCPDSGLVQRPQAIAYFSKLQFFTYKMVLILVPTLEGSFEDQMIESHGLTQSTQS